MTGKIFSDSGNVYQDQAKILFNYYQQVAEKIVKEEERIEKQIKSLEEEKALLQAEIGTFAFWVFTILTLSIYYFWKTKDIAKKVAAIDERIAEVKEELDQLAAERTEKAKLVNPRTLLYYERLRTKRWPVAVMLNPDSVCEGCHLKVPPSTEQMVEHKMELVACTNCGRMLYRDL